MTDTTEEFRMKQIEIILSKTPQERAMMGIDMIEATYKIVWNSIARENPEFSNIDIKIEVFKRFYSQ